MSIPNDIIDRTVAHYQRDRDKALGIIRSIREDGWRFYEAHGSEQMHDVTDQRLADQEEVVARSDGLIAAYEKHRA